MTNIQPLIVYRYKNLNVVVWKDNDVGKPTISIGRGYRPHGAKDFVNLKLSFYKDNIPALVKLLEAYLFDFPPVSGVDIVIIKKGGSL